MPTILICSLVLAFIAAFIVCFFMAKLTSLPGKVEREKDEFNLYGVKYDCTAKNIEVKTKVATAYEIPNKNN